VIGKLLCREWEIGLGWEAVSFDSKKICRYRKAVAFNK